MSFNILSLDGGGIFGAHTAVVLDRIAQQHPNFFSKIDLIAGTSIGGIIALAVGNGMTTAGVVDLFRTDAASLFSRDLVRRATGPTGVRAYYDASGRQAFLSREFGEKKLGDLTKRVVIQSFQFNGERQWQEYVYHNLPRRMGAACTNPTIQNSGSDDLVVDAGMATSAAPVYFPSHGNRVDGGVAANNPVMTALAMTQDVGYDIPNPRLEDVRVLSIGRIYAHSSLKESSVDWGYLGWALPLIDILLSGNVTVPDYQARQFLGNRYFRVATPIPPQWNSIDDTRDIPGLIEFSQNIDITDLQEWIGANW